MQVGSIAKVEGDPEYASPAAQFIKAKETSSSRPDGIPFKISPRLRKCSALNIYFVEYNLPKPVRAGKPE